MITMAVIVSFNDIIQAMTTSVTTTKGVFVWHTDINNQHIDRIPVCYKNISLNRAIFGPIKKTRQRVIMNEEENGKWQMGNNTDDYIRFIVHEIQLPLQLIGTSIHITLAWIGSCQSKWQTVSWAIIICLPYD